jgi:hypothetical protein
MKPSQHRMYKSPISTIDFRLSISVILHHFDNFYIFPNMGQQISLHILTFPKELFTMIASFMNVKSQLALAHTCETIYNYHKEQCKEIVTFLYYPPIDANYKYYCKVLECWLNEPGWAAVKAVFKEISADSQSNDSCLIRALSLNDSLQFPDELKCESINALVFTLRALPTLDISSLGKFCNLKMLWLSNIVINENVVSVLSTLSLLKIISLNNCEATDDHLSKMFETCTTLEEIGLYRISVKMPTMFPPQVKRLSIESFSHYMQIDDLSRCTQLQSL